jgi:hypothetical protein
MFSKNKEDVNKTLCNGRSCDELSSDDELAVAKKTQALVDENAQLKAQLAQLQSKVLFFFAFNVSHSFFR